MDYIKHNRRIHTAALFMLVFGLVLLALYVFDTYRQSSVVVPLPQKEENMGVVPTQDVSSTTYDSLIQHSEIVVPDTDIRVSLVDGRASYGTDRDGGDVFLSRVLGTVKVSEDMVHVFADIAVSSGGTGVFHYVGLFEVQQNNVQHRSSTFIGDRIMLEKVTLMSVFKDSYTVEINFLGRDDEQVLAEEPIVPKRVIREVKNATFVEAEPVLY